MQKRNGIYCDLATNDPCRPWQVRTFRHLNRMRRLGTTNHYCAYLGREYSGLLGIPEGQNATCAGFTVAAPCGPINRAPVAQRTCKFLPSFRHSRDLDERPAELTPVLLRDSSIHYARHLWIRIPLKCSLPTSRGAGSLPMYISMLRFELGR